MGLPITHAHLTCCNSTFINKPFPHLQSIMEQYNPCLRNFIAMGKNYEKALSSKYPHITSPDIRRFIRAQAAVQTLHAFPSAFNATSFEDDDNICHPVIQMATQPYQLSHSPRHLLSSDGPNTSAPLMRAFTEEIMCPASLMIWYLAIRQRNNQTTLKALCSRWLMKARQLPIDVCVHIGKCNLAPAASARQWP